MDKDNNNEIDNRKDTLLENDNDVCTDINESKLTTRSFLERAFSNMKEGSLRGSIFAISSLALGTGALALPIRATQMSLVWFTVFNFLAACAAYFSLKSMIQAARPTGETNYSSAVKRILGNYAGQFVDIIIVIYLFGVLIQYEIIIYNLIGRTVWEFGYSDKYKEFDNFENNIWNLAYLKYPIVYLIAILVLPMCLLKDVSKMRYASFFGIIALIYTILVVAIQCPYFFKYYMENIYKKDDPSTHANWFNIGKSFDSHFSFFTGIANLFFTYSCHPGAFPVYKTLKDNDERRINKVFFRSILLDFVIYVVISVTGFLTFPTNPTPLVIYRKNYVFKSDLLMTLAKIAMALDLFFCLPANYNSFRISFSGQFLGTQEPSKKQNVILTIVVLALTSLIGLLYKDILSYISLLGGFCSSIFCFLIPFSMKLKSADNEKLSCKNIAIFSLTVLLVSLGFLGGIQTVRENILGL